MCGVEVQILVEIISLLECCYDKMTVGILVGFGNGDV